MAEGTLVCSAPLRDKWRAGFQISGFPALWRMRHGCRKIIKKPLGGNAFASPAPDTATGCSLADESGTHQPWSRRGSPAAGVHLGPAPALPLSSHYSIFFLACEGFGSRKSSATFLHSFHMIAAYWDINALNLYNYSCVRGVYWRWCWVSGAGSPTQPRAALPLLPPVAKRQRFFCERGSAVRCAGIPLSPPRLLGARHLKGVFLSSPQRARERYGVSVPRVAVVLLFIAPEPTSGSWLSSWSFCRSEILPWGSVWPLLKFQNRRQPYLP